MRHRGLATGLLPAAFAACASAAGASETVAYTYDALGRLTATTSSGTVNDGAGSALSYDPVGNRRTYNVTGGVGGAPPPGGLGPLGAQPAGAVPAALEPDAADAALCQTPEENETAGPDAPTEVAATADPCR